MAVPVAAAASSAASAKGAAAAKGASSTKAAGSANSHMPIQSGRGNAPEESIKIADSEESTSGFASERVRSRVMGGADESLGGIAANPTEEDIEDGLNGVQVGGIVGLILTIITTIL